MNKITNVLTFYYLFILVILNESIYISWIIY